MRRKVADRAARAPSPVALLPSVDGIRDPAYRSAYSLLRPEARASEGRYLIEGVEMIERALRAGAGIDLAFLAGFPDRNGGSHFNGEPDLAERLTKRGVDARRIGPGLLMKLLGTGYETSVTALAVVRRRQVTITDLPPASEGRILAAAERIQDPRNVGVMVRTADAAGSPAFLLSADSADPTSRAAVRSSTGSILSLPVVQPPEFLDGLRGLRERGWRIVATSATANRRLWDADLTGPVALLFGNESDGLSPEARDFADDTVSIPLHGSAHSLNVTVAAGIVLYEVLRHKENQLFP